jgi:hypothetical protein
MKKLIFGLCLMTASLAQAGEIKLHSFSQYDLWGSASVSQQFTINEELERAWVTITVTANDPDGVGASDEVRVKIPGLTYNKATGIISIDFEGKVTDCAAMKTVGRSIFRRKELKMNPACKFEGRWRKISYDDGFEIKKTSKYEIFLVVE